MEKKNNSDSRLLHLIKQGREELALLNNLIEKNKSLQSNPEINTTKFKIIFDNLLLEAEKQKNKQDKFLDDSEEWKNDQDAITKLVHKLTKKVDEKKSHFCVTCVVL